MVVLRDYLNNPRRGGAKQVVIRFMESPVALLGTGAVEKIRLEKNTLSGDPGRQQANPTGQIITIDAGLVFKSIGYKGSAILGLPFDDKSGTIPNNKGAVVGMPGIYVAGWIKRGPKGVLGTNKPCSAETVATMVSQVGEVPPCHQPNPEAVDDFLRSRSIRWITYSDWKVIDRIEKERGAELGKPREKMTDLAAVFNALGR